MPCHSAGRACAIKAIIVSNKPKRSGNSLFGMMIGINIQLMATRTSALSTDTIARTGGHGRRLPESITFGFLSSIFEGGTV